MNRQDAKTPRVDRFKLSRALILGVLGVLAMFILDVGAEVAGDTFADGADGAKVHVASGFVCPAKIGAFERDAVGESDPEAGADFCAYAALDGVYGTIRLVSVARRL